MDTQVDQWMNNSFTKTAPDRIQTSGGKCSSKETQCLTRKFCLINVEPISIDNGGWEGNGYYSGADEAWIGGWSSSIIFGSKECDGIS